MSDDLVFEVPENVKAATLVDEAKYQEMYAESLRDPDAFWGEHGKRIDWISPYTKVKNTLYSKEDVSIKWYEDGTLNACVNCIDRHLEARGDEGADDSGQDTERRQRHALRRAALPLLHRRQRLLLRLDVGAGQWSALAILRCAVV